MSRVFVGVGSNEGDRLALISQAVKTLALVPQIQIVQMAVITETEPVGGPPQGPYLNTVVEVETTLTPQVLLERLQEIERVFGRSASAERWSPRTMDLDLLSYEDRIVQDAQLTLPHPRLHERRFVLEPLAQLAPDWVHPVLRKTVRELLAALPPSAARSQRPKWPDAD